MGADGGGDGKTGICSLQIFRFCKNIILLIHNSKFNFLCNNILVRGAVTMQ
jgi:hypothetical protein